MLQPVRTEETIGEVEVRQLFRVSRLGTIAGSYVTNGIGAPQRERPRRPRRHRRLRDAGSRS